MANEEAIIVNELDPEFKYEIMKQPGGEHITRCFTCGTCPAGCPVTNVDSQYNPKRIIRKVILGMREEVLSSPLLWLCELCYRCTAHCPQKVNFTDIMRALRYMSIKGHHIAPDILDMLDGIDRFSPALRHDLIKASFEKKEGLVEEIKSRLEEALQNT